MAFLRFECQILKLVCIIKNSLTSSNRLIKNARIKKCQHAARKPIYTAVIFVIAIILNYFGVAVDQFID